MSPLQLYDTRTRAEQTFVPADPPGQVGLFVCGPTVYDLPHLGHAKTYTQFDFLVRLLRARGFAVTYVQNITDVDDKIIRQIERLQEAAAAYATADGIYFDLTAFPDYGRLSGRRTNVLRGEPVSRLDANPHKRNAGDFVLWKARKPGEPFSASQLGDGRPGWHIEDTAVSDRLLGAQYDLHGGAIDLIFPHHEAEIAQMETISGLRPMVAYWLHTGLLTALTVVFDLVREQNRDGTRGQHARALVRDLLATFALDADAGSAVVDIDVDLLIDEREEHRRSRRFADADRIRDHLAAHGVILEDSPTGVRWRRSTR